MTPPQSTYQKVALYNPHLLTKDELLGVFSARQGILAQLLDDFRRTEPDQSNQHHLLIGQRGMGKTTLLRRLQFAIEDDSELSSKWMALTFPEEQYDVASLSDFWLNCLDALVDNLERIGLHNQVERLDSRIDSLRTEKEEFRSRGALELLVSAAESLGKRLILLVDNADLIFDRIANQEWVLREILSREKTIAFLGASSEAIEASYDYGRAFYDFFRLTELQGLNFEETKALLIHYSQRLNNPEVARIVENDSPRLRALHTLTGGNPRTIVLLYSILSFGVEGNVRTDLEQILDQSTPLYKARLDALPSQVQKVLHAVSVNWDPISAGELANGLGMDVNLVSAQLNRMVKEGIVQKVAYEPASKTGFQVAERFFNIWYLMRASRRVRRRLVWLVEFLRVFYSQEQLRSHALRHIKSFPESSSQERLRHAEYSFALAHALEACPLRMALENSGLQMIIESEDFQNQIGELVDLRGSDSALKGRATALQRVAALRKRLARAPFLGPGEADELLLELLRSPWLNLRGKEQVVSAVKERASLKKLVQFLRVANEEFALMLSSQPLWAALSEALQKGYMAGLDDLNGAESAEAILNTAGLSSIAAALRFRDKKTAAARRLLEKYLRGATSPLPWLLWLVDSVEVAPKAKIEKAVEEVRRLAGGNYLVLGLVCSSLSKNEEFRERTRELALEVLKASPTNGELLNRLGEALHDAGYYEDAIAAQRRAVELKPNHHLYLSNLAELMLYHSCDYKASQEMLERALALKSDSPRILNMYGDVLHRLGRYQEAAEFHRKVLELDDSDCFALNSLGEIYRCHLRDLPEAARMYRKSLEIVADEASNWCHLGAVLMELGQPAEAEEALRKSVVLDPNSVESWRLLAEILNEDPDRKEEAILAMRTALAVEPRQPHWLNSLAWTLFRLGVDLEEAELLASEAVAKEPKDLAARHTLACILIRRGKWPEAEGQARIWISEGTLDFHETTWGDILVFFRLAVQVGRAKEAAHLLDEYQLADRWRPLREALEALVRNTDRYLLRVAPEVRQPAEDILADLKGSVV